jgi:hypothetical protein
VENIFKGVSSWSIFKATGGPGLIKFFLLTIVFGVLLGLAAKWLRIPNFLISPIVGAGSILIIYYVVTTT